ncbi:helix-hairpin-helix domain-containing protein [Hydrogenimonas urashimensis]|uniref:helix-hairpin-helix domain-containing protein n=1 Tax=Hydrogenimonas urashimensis TaxID=2740515 RepID=UPI001916C06F|nr:helix-hairpin-helix domain-containing protein [Hydrogenimonas urashimensis]
MAKKRKLPKIGLLYLDYVLRFFDRSNFKGWPDKIETVVYHWGNDKDRFIEEVKRKKIDILVGNIPATAYETFREIAKALPHVRFVPSLETQFANKSKENVTLFCEKHNLSHPETKIFYDREEGYRYLEECDYPIIVKRSYGPSNYGGYYVHKVKSKEEAKKLFDEKKYMPMYIQECIPLRADIRVMLIGHKPACAFWRVAGEDMDLTNTSQGGYMTYDGVPMGALELAVEASKAAKAEYWACDIAEYDGKYYILECATAFAAFPYFRDWIGQYLMWDFSEGYFKKPHIPLYNWEELGKINPSLLRTMRHIEFSRYIPSTDGAYYLNDKEVDWDIELTEESVPEDIPDDSHLHKPPLKKEEEIPEAVLEEAKKGADVRDALEDSEMSLESVTLTELMTLHGMEEEIAVEVIRYIHSHDIKSLDELLELEGIDKQTLKVWAEALHSKTDVNKASTKALAKIKNIGKKLAEKIVEFREKHGPFEKLEDLMKVKGLGKKKFEKIKEHLAIK